MTQMVDPTDTAMDIETTGLSPWDSRVVTVAFVSENGDHIETFDNPEDEVLLLTQVEEYVRKTRMRTLVGWNHQEFDLPFMAARFALNGVDMPPFIRATGATGKYGKPMYDGQWYGAGFRDIAYEYEVFAKKEGVKWSLIPVAQALDIGVGMHERLGFAEGATILDLTSSERELYCASDAQLTFGLYALLPQDKVPVTFGQVVLVDGGFSIL